MNVNLKYYILKCAFMIIFDSGNFDLLAFSKQIIQNTDTYERAGTIVRKLEDNEIALTLYTDGGQLTVSTNQVVWPIILWLNELPGKVRQSFKNAVWVSLWFDLCSHLS